MSLQDPSSGSTDVVASPAVVANPSSSSGSAHVASPDVVATPSSSSGSAHVPIALATAPDLPSKFLQAIYMMKPRPSRSPELDRVTEAKAVLPVDKSPVAAIPWAMALGLCWPISFGIWPLVMSLGPCPKDA